MLGCKLHSDLDVKRLSDYYHEVSLLYMVVEV